MNFCVRSKKIQSSIHSNNYDEISLGGAFYDYFRNKIGVITGVRYYLIDEIIIEKHPIYMHFIDNKYFFFNQKNNYIDLFFNLDDTNFIIDYVQDFGGENFFIEDGYCIIYFNNIKE